MADIIKLLPDHVANQIAAGEVVQRPASVVKELLENAIDAGASSIKLIIKDGGKTLVHVVDNGSGMSETDARLSFERHATSKITTAEDLFNLNTKGFRGEALASIAAIAHVDLQSKTENAEVGTQIKIEGSKVLSQEITVTPKGTSIAVKNLFFNIPARRNFLKSNQVELRHITDEFQRVALVHPNVAFQFYNNGAELFNLPSENLRQRIVHIFGSKMNERLVPVEENTEVLKVKGFICKPEFAKKSRGVQFFFANGRFIKSPYLHHAVLSAFEGLIKTDAIPGYFLNLQVDPSAIDINIHPTKTEVKFDDENTLYAILRSTIKHSLGQFNVVPALDFNYDQNLDTPYHFQQKGAVRPSISVDSSFNPFVENKSGASGVTGFQKASAKGWEKLFEGIDEDTNSFSSVQFETEMEPSGFFDEQETIAETSQTTFQLKRKYIVTSLKSGMLVIDQNRAHQRILFEKFVQNTAEKEGVSQQLLFPMVLKFAKNEITIFKTLYNDLMALGFVFDFGDQEITVSGIPNMMAESSIGSVLKDLLQNYTEEGYTTETLYRAALTAQTLARTLSIKSGQVLNSASQLALVNDLFGCKEPKLTPSNKIIYITLDATEIENKFK
ncbi:MAG: DNA mismatch repair endonuclease MutL [Croceitalea sp.]|nr:DNA mismatch repair endonuclease MutL [Croceitalea sp.]